MALKIISGGQTGVDRAALDAAIEGGLDHGGWCPKGRLAEDGVIAPCYRLSETPSSDYVQRTEWNVRDSDGTLILFWFGLEGGTKLTVDFCQKYHKPHLLVDMTSPVNPREVVNRLGSHAIQVLNVAGPRASKGNGIYEKSKEFLDKLFSVCR